MIWSISVIWVYRTNDADMVFTRPRADNENHLTQKGEAIRKNCTEADAHRV